MLYLNAFKSNEQLITKYEINKAYLIWVMGLYLDYPDLDELASECLTDDSDDKKIDFLKIDLDNKKIIFAQGYYSNRLVDSAPANKAADLNTASAWLISGDLNEIPKPLREIIDACRNAIDKGDVEQIDLLYVHNLPESVAVSKELKTVGYHLLNSLSGDKNIIVIAKELGIKETEDLFTEQASQIVIKEALDCPAEIEFETVGPNWSAAILTVPGNWLRDQFLKYGDKLFSANYRGFLGITKRRKINSGIKSTAEKQASNFWVYNNGITILTLNYRSTKHKTTELMGLSIINGAQTTGSIGSLDSTMNLNDVKVLTRVIKCSDEDTIAEIIKYNNTQNKITTWDKFSNDSIQKTIREEFQKFGHSYSLKRGFSDHLGEIGIEVVAQPLIALQGAFQEANRGKNGIFESDLSYKTAFEGKKARHILFAYCISRAIDERRSELKKKKEKNTIIDIEEKQLSLLRNLRFKYFFMSVFGKCLEAILTQKVDIKNVGFTPDASKISNKSINDLVAEILPVINIALTYTVSTINGKEFADILSEENSIDRILAQVSAIIYATTSAAPNAAVESFKKIITPN